MKPRLTAIVLLICVLPAGFARAADTIKPGRWEFTSEMQAAGMPQLPPGVSLPPGVQQRAGGGIGVNHTMCIDTEKAVPTDPRPECRTDRLQHNGPEVHWSTTCTTPQGTVRSDGVAHYAGDTMQANLTTHIPQADGRTMQTSQHITGRYLGPCTAR